MQRIVLFIAVICMSVTAQADPERRNYFSFLESALKSYSSTATSAVLVEDLSSQLILENKAGAIGGEHWTEVPEQEFQMMIASLKNEKLNWSPSNVSALSKKGTSLIVFADKDGEALFGLIHEKSWKPGQYRLAIVSGNLGTQVSLDGALSLALIERSRIPARDVPYLLEFPQLPE